MPSKTKPRPTPGHLDLEDLPRYTVADALELTNTSRSTIYRAIRDGRLPAYRFGGQVRFRGSDLLAMFEPIDSSAS